jgi:hypothetical protein
MTYDEDWRQDALCLGKNQDIWYPPLESQSPEQYYAVGREICRACPVWELCLADSRGEKYGMWAGLTPRDRQGAFENRETHLKMHGWLRYRQGCRCEVCTKSHWSNTTGVKVNLSLIPSALEPLEDLDALRYGLAGS